LAAGESMCSWGGWAFGVRKALQVQGGLWEDCGMARIRKNAAAVALGRLGGLRGGKARAAKMTAAERSASARKAVLARWAKAKKAQKRLEHT
jgi:hypothetical protein